MTSLRLARQVLASDNLLVERAVSVSDRDAVHATWHHTDARTPPLRRVGRQFPMSCKHTSWRHARIASSDKGRNVALLSCTTLNTPSHPNLQHANSDRGTQVLSTISAGLQLGPNVASYPHTQTVESTPNYSEKAPGVPSNHPHPTSHATASMTT
jgi:hypothetical protein